MAEDVKELGEGWTEATVETNAFWGRKGRRGEEDGEKELVWF